jgi:hypothetical protein
MQAIKELKRGGSNGGDSVSDGNFGPEEGDDLVLMRGSH